MVCGVHDGWLKVGGTKRGHCQEDLGLNITVPVTSCQMIN